MAPGKAGTGGGLVPGPWERLEAALVNVAALGAAAIACLGRSAALAAWSCSDMVTEWANRQDRQVALPYAPLPPQEHQLHGAPCNGGGSGT